MTSIDEITNKTFFDEILEQKKWQLHLIDTKVQFPIETAMSSPINTQLSSASCFLNTEALVAKELGRREIPHSYFNYDYFNEGILYRRVDVESNQYKVPLFNLSTNSYLSETIPSKMNIIDEIFTTQNDMTRLYNIRSDSVGSATLKVISMVDLDLWNTRNLLFDARESIVANASDTYYVDILSKIYPNSNIPSMSSANVSTFLTNNLQTIDAQLFNQINSMNNPSTYESIFMYFLSKNVAAKLTPFHPLFYTSFRTMDNVQGNNLFGKNTPVNCIVFESTGGSIDDFLLSYNFEEVLDVQRELLMSIYAQTIFGLHLFQTLSGGVVSGNVMSKLRYVPVSTDLYIYYMIKYENLLKLRDAGYVSETDPGFDYYFYYALDVYFAVPTYGGKIVLTDLSQAKMQITGKDVFAEEKIGDEEVDKSRYTTDLLNFHTTFYSEWFNILSPIRSQDPTIYNLMNEIEACPPQPFFNNTESRYQEIQNDNLFTQSSNFCGADDQCYSDNTLVYPFIKNGTCPFSMALPERLFRYMSEFMVDKPEDPCTIVYNLYP